jgi:hypothetical protein
MAWVEIWRMERSIFLTFVLTSWDRDLLAKLRGSQLFRKVPEFCGTREVAIYCLLSRLPEHSVNNACNLIINHIVVIRVVSKCNTAGQTYHFRKKWTLLSNCFLILCHMLKDNVYINVLHTEGDMKWNAEWYTVLRWCEMSWNKVISQ